MGLLSQNSRSTYLSFWGWSPDGVQLLLGFNQWLQVSLRLFKYAAVFDVLLLALRRIGEYTSSFVVVWENVIIFGHGGKMTLKSFIWWVVTTAHGQTALPTLEEKFWVVCRDFLCAVSKLHMLWLTQCDFVNSFHIWDLKKRSLNIIINLSEPKP